MAGSSCAAVSILRLIASAGANGKRRQAARTPKRLRDIQSRISLTITRRSVGFGALFRLIVGEHGNS